MLRNRVIPLALALALSAGAQGVPFEWDAEASVALAAAKDVYRGETVSLRPGWLNYGDAADTNGWTFTLCWQTNGMGSAWWTDATNAFLWTPARDCGAPRYTLFIRAASPNGVSYRANAVFKMLTSPGFTPAELPPPSVYPTLAADILALLIPSLPTYDAWTNEAALRVSGDLFLNSRIDAIASTNSTRIYNPTNVFEWTDGAGRIWRTNSYPYVNLRITAATKTNLVGLTGSRILLATQGPPSTDVWIWTWPAVSGKTLSAMYYSGTWRMADSVSLLMAYQPGWIAGASASTALPIALSAQSSPNWEYSASITIAVEPASTTTNVDSLARKSDLSATPSGLDTNSLAAWWSGVTPYLQVGNTIYGGSITQNFNTILHTGPYSASAGAIGAPVADPSFFIWHNNSNLSTNGGVQLMLSGESNPRLWLRNKSGGAWGPAYGGCSAQELGFLVGLPGNIVTLLNAKVSATGASNIVSSAVALATNALVQTYLISSNAWITANWSNQTLQVSLVQTNGATNVVSVGGAQNSIDPQATNLLWQALSAANASIAGKADKAWGKYAPDGSANPDPDYMTFLNSAATLFASGCAWSTYGTYAVLTSPGTVAFASGSNGVFRIGPDSTNYFGYATGGSVLVGAEPDTIRVYNGGATNGYAEIDYYYLGGDFPVIWFAPSLTVDFFELTTAAWVNNLDGTATVTVPATTAGGFWRATTSATFANVFETTMPAHMRGGVIGSTNALPVVYDSVIEITSGGATYRVPAQRK